VRIAVYHNLPSGGGKRALFEMTKRVAARHRVDVYTLSCAEHDFCDLRPHCAAHAVFPFDPLPLARSPFGRLNQGIRAVDLMRLRALQRGIARKIDAAGYDVAFAHNCRYSQSPGVLSFLHTPSVYYCQEPPRNSLEPTVPRPYNTLSLYQRVGNLFDPLPALYRAVLIGLDRANVLSADLVLVNSAYSRETLYRVYGIFARVCYLGVDAERFGPLPLAEAEFVLSVGAINPRKGFDFLVRSLAWIDSGRRPRLVIVSNAVDDRERAYLQELSSQLDVDVDSRVQVNDEDLVRLYSQAKLTLYAPIMEPFGFVPLESMACGTPVVGVREAGVRETVVHGTTGLLTDRDPRVFAAAVEELMSDSSRRRDLGRRGRGHVETEWGWDRSVHQLEEYLAQAAGSTRKAV
jgi:glycosyltransferase involved in cell wall biosynthesis